MLLTVELTEDQFAKLTAQQKETGAADLGAVVRAALDQYAPKAGEHSADEQPHQD